MRRINNVIIVTVVVVVLLILAAILIAIYDNSTKSKPEDVLKTYFSYLQNRRI